MESDRISTLQAIESISAVSEETRASSNTVYDTVVSQSESIADLEEAAAKLYDNVTDLNTALNLFKI